MYIICTYLAGNWIGSSLELTESISSVYVRFGNICFGLFPGSSILSYKFAEMELFLFSLLCYVFSIPLSRLCLSTFVLCVFINSSIHFTTYVLFYVIVFIVGEGQSCSILVFAKCFWYIFMHRDVYFPCVSLVSYTWVIF